MGVFFRDGQPVEHPLMKRMTDSVAHRGPDGCGIWLEGSVGLGHRMLWTTPESLQEQLPLTSNSGDYVITADARVDNRDELLPILDLPDSVSDSQVILSAYEKWGIDCLTRLIGDFAFVIWDKRNQFLFCARDHFGIKPFYYYTVDQVFVFASEIKGVLSVPDVPQNLNEMQVVNYLLENFSDKNVTFYKGILRLSPAHMMIIRPAGMEVKPYWSLDPERELTLKSDAAYVEAYRELFAEVVRCRLRSAFPNIGSMLSGGLDSTAITCVARDLLADDDEYKLHTYSNVFDDVPESDEREFIEAVIAQGNIEPHLIRGDQTSPLYDADRWLWVHDEAFHGYNMFLAGLLYEAGQNSGVRVMLDGMMGDAIVPHHGSAYMMELAATGRWLALTRESRKVAARLNFSPWGAIWFNIWLHGLKPHVPARVKQTLRRFRKPSSTAKPEATSIVNPEFVRGLGRQPHQVETGKQRGSRKTSIARLAHYRDINSGMVPFTVELTNRLAASYSIESRYPYLDKRLVEFCLALPSNQKLKNGWPRAIARNAIDAMPDKVRWRRDKGNLSYNFKRSLLAYEREQLDEIILTQSEVVEPYVNIKEVQKKYHSFIEQGYHASNDKSSAVWLTVTLALWLRYANLRPSQ
jgi:asparagine synthase (glutamine-hydrolysing)